MSGPLNEATRAQHRAARPDRSTWLSANAGSGKTRVLTDRVARLLLNGVDPQKVLCLTYTKAAASEMQNRLFARLGEWAMLPDGDLRNELDALGETGSVTPQKLLDARRLFARAIETPGGLRIQTIHSFCSSLLRRFPLEAGVSPRFAEMDDRTASLLRGEVIDNMADSPEHSLVSDMARLISDSSLDDLTRAIASNSRHFTGDMTLNDALSRFDLPAGFGNDDVLAAAFTGDEPDLITAILPAFRAGSANDVKAAEQLARVSDFDMAALPQLENVFLTKGGKTPFSAKIGTVPTKATQENLAHAMHDLNAFMERIETARELRTRLAAAHQTLSLHRFARAFLDRYEARKLAHGWLDFDDLILRARALLSDDHVAGWVLYRLDGGIDHILVDEAQDTSPVQWQVIERLAQEFTSGQGARGDTLRTIFVVGDKKQSIFSFQGADPREFDRMQAEFGERLSQTPAPLQVAKLLYSFRSSHAVLSLVDDVFRGRETSGFAADQTHVAFKDALPGRVDLWPVIEKSDQPPAPVWTDPVDLTGPQDPVSVLANAIASEIRRMIDQKVQIPLDQTRNGEVTSRAVHAGDILILMRRRSPLFHAIIRECKARDLPIAGADRLKLGQELAVRDIISLLRFLATPEDDLSLAEALKSPLFGWSEQALFTLAHTRKGFLWEALRENATQYPDTLAVLDDLRRKVDYLRPYDLIERILTRHAGRKALLARLGVEAEDGIDALLAQALTYERVSVPSLTGFLVWFDTDDVEIKRQMESGGARIRVMTVHGAKGLEAPVVILPDTAQPRNRDRDAFLVAGDGAVWKPTRENWPKHLDPLKEARQAREEEERDRLLYVAMTRAEKWLIVAAAGSLGKDGRAWHEFVRRGMESGSAAQAHGFPTGEGLRVDYGDWAMSETVLPSATPEVDPAIPDYALTPAPVAEPRPKPLAPSELGGAKALAGEDGQDEDSAKRHGRQVHRLLEVLPAQPPGEWPTIAARLLADGADAAKGNVLSTVLNEATGVLNTPALAPLFSSNALAEVPVSAFLPELNGRRVHGVIDRLIISDTEVLAVDFKSNAAVPASVDAVPAGLLRQMGAYASALAQVWPEREIVTALLWTRTATLMRLPHDVVIGALCDSQIS